MLFGRFALVPRPIRWCLGLVVGAILLVTLSPGDVTERTPDVWCVVCGDRGVADFILNVILFLPLGGILRVAGARVRTVFLAGLALSMGIELTQAFIPGRDSTLGDVISNTAGCLLGALVVRGALSLLATPRRAGLVAAGWAALSLATVTLTGYLLGPDYPSNAYYGQWTADLDGGLDWYRGHVLRATLGGVPAPSRRLDDQPAVHALLRSGALLSVTAVAGPVPRRIAPIFSVYDDRTREILLLGPRGPDLILRYRTRGLAWLLDHPYLTMPNAMAGVSPGDTIHLSLWRDEPGGSFMVARDDRRYERLGFTAGAGWSVLIYPPHFPAWLRDLLDAAWVGGMLLVLGFLAPSWSTRIASAASIAVGLAVLPGMVGLLPTTGIEWIATLIGLMAGVSVRKYAAK